jgi:Thioredoxin
MAAVVLLSWMLAAWQGTAPPDYGAVYAKGITFAAFLDLAKSRTSEWRQHYNDAAVAPETISQMRALPERRRILVVAEDWCADSVNSLPYLVRLVDGAPERLELRIVDSVAGKAIQKAHRTADGRAATPTVVVLTEDGRYVGSWTERPAALRDHVAELKKTLSESEVKGRIRQWYLADAGKSAMADTAALLSK